MINIPTTDQSDVALYRKAASVFTFLVVLPCLLSLINITFAQSWKLHFFPAAIILASVFYGAKGGIVAGISGSLYSALFLGNPYIIVGNAIFGLLIALFYKKNINLVLCVLLAYFCELPWLIFTDYYFVHLSSDFIAKVVIVLLLANILWAALISINIKHIRKLF